MSSLGWVRDEGIGSVGPPILTLPLLSLLLRHVHVLAILVNVSREPTEPLVQGSHLDLQGLYRNDNLIQLWGIWIV